VTGHLDPRWRITPPHPGLPPAQDEGVRPPGEASHDDSNPVESGVWAMFASKSLQIRGLG